MSVKGSTGDSGRLHVHDKKAELIEVIQSEAAITLLRVFDNLPQHVKTEV